MDKSEVYREVDLITLLRALWRRSWVIALATVAAGAVCFAWAQFLIAPTYEASALLYVNNTQDASKPISNSELSAAQSLVDTYVVILNSRTTLDQVRAAARVTYTDRELQKMIQAQAVNSTEVFEVTVTSEDPQEAQKIANTIAQVLPSRISSVVEGSSVRVVAAPSLPRYTVLGMAAGFLLSCAALVLRELLDNQIRGEDYLLQAYPQVPVLAVIPELLQRTEGYGYGYGSRSAGKEGQPQ